MSGLYFNMINTKTDTRPKTIFCDIDGTLVRHRAPTETTSQNLTLDLLPGTIEKLGIIIRLLHLQLPYQSGVVQSDRELHCKRVGV